MDIDNNNLNLKEQKLLDSLIRKAESDGAMPNLMRALKGHLQDQSCTAANIAAYIPIFDSLNQIASKNKEITLSPDELHFLQHTLPSKIELARNYLINADQTTQAASLRADQNSNSLSGRQKSSSSQDSIESDRSLKDRAGPDTLDSNSVKSDRDRSSDSDFSGSVITPPGTQRKTRSQDKLPEHKLRGSHSTYAKKMYAEFQYEIKNNQYIIAADAKLTRPAGVTGSLPSKIEGDKVRSEGDHLIAVSWKLREIANIVRGKEASAAVQALFEANASNTAYIDDNLLKKAKSYFPTASASNEDSSTEYPDLIARHKAGFEILERIANDPTQSIDNAHLQKLVLEDKAALTQEENSKKAFEFLKEEFIPKLYAAWNQRGSAAFLKHDSQAQSNAVSSSKDVQTSDTAESSKVRKALADLFAVEDLSSPQAINAYVSLIDYKVVSKSVADDAQHVSQRSNKLEVLIEVLHDITREYLDAYYQNINNPDAVSKSIIAQTLEQGGWYEHFKTNEFKEELKEHFGNDAQSIVIGTTIKGNMQELFYEEIRQRNPMAFIDLDSVHSSEVGSNNSIHSNVQTSQSQLNSTASITSDSESSGSRSRSNSSTAMDAEDNLSSDTPPPSKKSRQYENNVTDADNSNSKVSSTSQADLLRRALEQRAPSNVGDSNFKGPVARPQSRFK